MSVTLSSADVTGLERALATLTRPLDHSDPLSWGAAIMTQCRRLLGADQAYCGVPLNGRIQVQWEGDRAGEAFESYQNHYWQLDRGFSEHRRQRGLEVYSDDLLYEGSGFTRTDAFAEFFHEWLSPNRLHDAIGMGCDMVPGPLPAGMNFYHESEFTEPFGERGLVILRLLNAAFKAGVQGWLQLESRRTQLERAIDALHDGAMLVTETGRVLHENTTLAGWQSADPEFGHVRSRMLGIASSLRRVSASRKTTAVPTQGEPAWQEVRTATATYRVSGIRLSGGMVGPDPAVLVSVLRVGTQPMTDVDLRTRYRLTPREVQVARAIARGDRNDAIASTLGISRHTAWNHSERVLMKLGVSSRAAVAHALMTPSSTPAVSAR